MFRSPVVFRLPRVLIWTGSPNPNSVLMWTGSPNPNSVMQKMSIGLASTVTLNDGVRIPMFGLGCYKAAAAGEVSAYAVKHGYRMLDTAEMYNNEKEIGQGIKDSGLKREDIFVVTKVLYHGYDATRSAFKNSLKKLDTGYVDLYLMHHPMHGKVLQTYDAMLELKQEGLIRSVGVSNFGIHHLEALRDKGLPTPSVNQIELHPWLYQQTTALIDYCHNHGITVMGYSPLCRMEMADDPIIQDLATKYNRTAAQVMIRWSVQKGYITIPKSDKLHRIRQNAEVFDFAFTEEEMVLLDTRPAYRCAWNPLTVPWTD